MKKILFPTDFSQVSQHALRFAIDFAKECNAVID
ncbi:MAG: universal stress protein, partial [Bacteroidota bacterium]